MPWAKAWATRPCGIITPNAQAAAAGASPHALKNIAEGFGTGLAGYKESLKEFKKAEQERTKALADIEQARRAEKRGDVDAALYWLARLLEGGEDPLFVARRMVIFASEDVGQADPQALVIAVAAAQALDLVGLPEAQLNLAQACIYLACAPKSNAAYSAYNSARAFVSKDASRPVPLHLRNAPTRLMKELGYGKTYRYAHDEPHAYAAGERYLPDGMQPPGWYQPTDRGLEAKIADKLAWLRSLDAQVRSNPRSDPRSEHEL